MFQKGFEEGVMEGSSKGLPKSWAKDFATKSKGSPYRHDSCQEGATGLAPRRHWLGSRNTAVRRRT